MGRGAVAPGMPRAAGIVLGVALDAAFGDPRRGHPVAGFGRYALLLERLLYAPTRRHGVAFTVAAVGVPVVLSLAAENAVRQRPVARTLLTAATTWACLGGTSLAVEGAVMAARLEAGDLVGARVRLSHLCARDPAGMQADDLARATVESLAENTSDATVAPLLWAALGGVPGVVGYRAANTLDAMVGYRSPRYEHFGWASARFDDLVNLVPARLTAAITVAVAPVVGGSRTETWRTVRVDGRRHPSPNAGPVEASAAGALRLRLGGSNVYAGQREDRPVLGAAFTPPRPTDIPRAVRLGRVVSVAATGVAASVALGFARWRAQPAGGRR